jgi:hypothetical protein
VCEVCWIGCVVHAKHTSIYFSTGMNTRVLIAFIDIVSVVKCLRHNQSSPAGTLRLCVFIYVSVVLCVWVEALGQTDPPTQGVLLIMYRIKEL